MFWCKKQGYRPNLFERQVNFYFTCFGVEGKAINLEICLKMKQTLVDNSLV